MLPRIAFPRISFPRIAFPWPPFAADAGPVLVDRELPTWLKAQLGQPVWLNRVPQRATRPALVFQFTGGRTALLLSGPGDDATYQVQFDAYADDPAGAAALIERLRQALDGYRGPMGRADCQTAIAQGPAGGFDPFGSGSDSGIARRTQEYTLVFSIPAPVR